MPSDAQLSPAHVLALEWHRANAYGCALAIKPLGNGKAKCTIAVWRKGAPDVKRDTSFEFPTPNGAMLDALGPVAESFAKMALAATISLPFVETDE